MKRLAFFGTIVLLVGFLRAEAQCTLSVSYTITPACPGTTTGKIQFAVANGTPSYQVYLNNTTFPALVSKTSSFVLENLAAGSYIIRIADVQGCVRIFTALTVPSALVPNVQVSLPDQVCEAVPFVVAASLDASYAPPYTFIWNNGKTSSSFTDVLSSTTKYAVTVTDVNGCRTSISAGIVVNDAPVVSMLKSIQTCKGESIKLSPTAVSGGTPAYTYKWNTGSKANAIEVAPTSATTYSLTVTDAKGCSDSGSTLVDPTKTLAVSLPAGLELCEGATTTLTASVGTNAGGLTFLWNTGARTASISIIGDITRSYAVTVEDGAGCVGAVSASVAVNVPPTINLADRAIVCKGESITLNPALETSKGPFIYRWSTGASSATLTLSPTTDQVIGLTIIDSKKCSRQKSIALDVVEVPTVSLPTAVQTCSNSALTLSAKVAGGTPEYTYSWSAGGTSATLTRIFTKDEQVQVRVKDANGCLDSTQTLVRVGTPPTVGFSTNLETCPGQSVLLTPVVNGGAGGYTYSWSTGASTSSIQVAPTTAMVFGVTVTDGNACVGQSTVTVTPSKMLTVTLPPSLDICAQQSFSLTPSVRGNTGALTYTWSTGFTGNTLSLIAETSRTYEVVVKDATGCTGVTQSMVTVHVAPAINLPDEVGTCLGGTIALNPSLDPNKGPYSYQWSNGATTPTLSLQPTASLVIGVTITDGFKCTREKNTSVKIAAGPEIVLPDTVQACSNTALILSARVAGGTPEYIYSWSVGGSSASITRIFTKDEQVQVRVQDVNGCLDSTQTLVRVGTPPTVGFSTNLETCPGQSVLLTPVVNGGAGGYTYSWSIGASTSSIQVAPTTTMVFGVTVTDRNTCVGQSTVTVTPSKMLTVTLPPSLDICAQQSFSLTPTVRGNTGALTYTWSTGFTGNTLSLIAETSRAYEVVVKDATGCTGVAQSVVTVHVAPVINLPDTVALCSGDTVVLNPSLDISKGPYSYQWSSGATTAILMLQPISSLVVGVTITDEKKCMREKKISVEVSAGPLVVLPDTIQACSNEEKIVRANVSGGIPGYQFTWNIGGDSDTLRRTFLQSGMLVVGVRDAGGCKATARTFIEVVEPPTFVLPAQVTVCKGSSIKIGADKVVGQTPFLFSWSTRDSASKIVVVGERDQLLHVQVTDRYGCKTNGSVAVDVVSLEGISIPKDTVLCVGDSLLLQVLGAGSDITFLWNTGSKMPFIRTRPMGSVRYEVQIENLLGCRDTLSTAVTLQELPEVLLPDSIPLCSGDSVLLTPIVRAKALPVTFVWENGKTNTPRVIQESGNYALTITDGNRCRNTWSAKATVFASPVVQLPERLSACTGTALTIHPVISANAEIASVRWTDGQQVRSIIHPVRDSVFIACKVTDKLGCSGMDSVAIIPFPTPQIELPERVAACAGSKVRLVPLSAAGDSYGIQWNTGVLAPFIEVLAQGVSNYEAVATNSQGCKDTAQVQVQAYALPQLDILGDRDFCASNPGQLRAEAREGMGPYQYVWNTGSTQQTTEVNTRNNTGVIQVRVTDSHGCMAEDTAQVRILLPPLIQVAEVDTVCENQSQYLAPLVTGGQRPYQYRWSTGDTTAVALVGAGRYDLEVTDAKGCQGVLSIEVEKREAPEITVLSLRRPGCNTADGAVELSVNSGALPVQVQWSTGATGMRVTSLLPGTYQVAARDAFNCTQEVELKLVCTCTAKVGVMDNRFIDFCKTEQKTGAYNASGEVIPPGAKRWFVLHNGAGVTLGNIVLALDTVPRIQYVAGMLPDKTYYLSALITNPDAQGKPDLNDPCLALSAGTPVTLLPTPDKPSELIVADTLVCPGSSILLSTNRQASGYSYVWETPKGRFKTGTPAFTVGHFSTSDIGSYYVSAESGRCMSAPHGPLRLGVAREVAEIFAEPDKIVCGIDTTLVQANAPAGVGGKWLTSSPATILNPETEQATVKGLTPGVNVFIWTVITRNCIIQDSLEVYYMPRPGLRNDTVYLDDEKNAALFDLLQNDTLRDIPNKYLKVKLISQPATGAVRIDSSGSITYIRDNTIGEDQELTFQYQVCNTDPLPGCAMRCDEAQVTLFVAYSPRTLIYPSIGLRPGQSNPLWQFEAARPMFSARLSILDRWGQVVYREQYEEIQKGELVKSWNGLRGNTALPPGAYYFTLEGIVENNEKIIQNGILYLLE